MRGDSTATQAMGGLDLIPCDCQLFSFLFITSNICLSSLKRSRDAHILPTVQFLIAYILIKNRTVGRTGNEASLDAHILYPPLELVLLAPLLLDCIAHITTAQQEDDEQENEDYGSTSTCCYDDDGYWRGRRYLRVRWRES